MPRIFCPQTLIEASTIDLPERAVKHVQVLRLQPGSELVVFNGLGGEFTASIIAMGRQSVQIQIHTHLDVERENQQGVHLMVGMPANDRMDWLVEKATELGVQRITPLMTQRSVLKLHGERATKKTQHWHHIAIGACEQCGRNRVPLIDEPLSLSELLHDLPLGTERWVLSTQTPTHASHNPLSSSFKEGSTPTSLTQVLSGPEGGLDPKEESELIKKGFVPWSLGARVLRAETAALYALMSLSQQR
jgi:16S rRNA (uracil1498-N3)-methyltransferase